MQSSGTLLPTESIKHRIFTLRGRRVLLDVDLARVYGVSTARLNEAVKRNARRFPIEFRFRLTGVEMTRLISQIAISNIGRGGRRTLPWAFTEHGALMAATVLRSRRAEQMSIYIVRAFLRLREELATNAAILKRLAEIDHTLVVHDAALRDLYAKLQPLLLPPPPGGKREIGFHVWLPPAKSRSPRSIRPAHRAQRVPA